MKLKDVERYFKALSKKAETPLVIALTGGIAAGILADERSTDDIDFAILRFVKNDWPRMEAELNSLAAKHGILIQFSTDIDRWSMVSYLSWRRHSRSYRRYGKLEVRVLDPYYWSIGKIARATQRDVEDLKAVAKKQKMNWKKMAGLWARALKKSPPSSGLHNVKRQMENFFREAKAGVFGKGYDPEEALLFIRKQFERKAGRKS